MAGDLGPPAGLGVAGRAANVRGGEGHVDQHAARSARDTENEETYQQLSAISGTLAREPGRELIATYAEDARCPFSRDSHGTGSEPPRTDPG
jgi:hypothetical protein